MEAEISVESRSEPTLMGGNDSPVQTPPNGLNSTFSQNAGAEQRTYIETAELAAFVADANESSGIYAASTRYRRTKLLGEGGLGRVWLAQDQFVGRDVAIKELHPDRAGNEDMLARFIREARISARLQHPNIAPFFHIGVDDCAKPFIVMQRIGGVTLEEKIRTLQTSGVDWTARRSELHELVAILLQVCAGVAFAHSRGVIHRDLKPANVMIGEFGEVIVLDWGLGKEVGAPDDPRPNGSMANDAGDSWTDSWLADASTTQAGSVLGTLDYMAPEQAGGDEATIGVRSDVFALGGILHFILTGRAPHKFAGGSFHSAVARIRTASIPPTRMLNPSTPRPLAAIIAKATALDPDKRYASALELAADLKRWLSGERVLAYREPAPQRLARWALQRRLTMSMLALAGFTVVLVSAMANLHQWASIESLVTEELLETRDRVQDVANGIQREVQLIAALMNFVSGLPSIQDSLTLPDGSTTRSEALGRAARTLNAFVDRQPHVVNAMLVDRGGAPLAFADVTRPRDQHRRMAELARRLKDELDQIRPGQVLFEPVDLLAPGAARARHGAIVGVPVRKNDSGELAGAVLMETLIGVQGFHNHDSSAVALANRPADCFVADRTGRVRFHSLNTGQIGSLAEGAPMLTGIFPELASLVEETELPATLEVRHSHNNFTVFAHRMRLEETYPAASPIIAVARPIDMLRDYSARRNGYLICAAVLIISMSACLASAIAWIVLRMVRFH